jgi:hypothetical protein
VESAISCIRVIKWFEDGQLAWSLLPPAKHLTHLPLPFPTHQHHRAADRQESKPSLPGRGCRPERRDYDSASEGREVVRQVTYPQSRSTYRRLRRSATIYCCKRQFQVPDLFLAFLALRSSGCLVTEVLRIKPSSSSQLSPLCLSSSPFVARPHYR